MKKPLLLASLFLFTYILPQAQSLTNLSLGNIRIPDSLTNSTAGIAAFISSNYKTDFEKVRAIHAWVTSNIRYDLDSSNQVNLGTDPLAKINVALRRRRGVCENFASIYCDISKKAGIPAFVVQGYTKQSGTIDRTGHSWVAIKVNNEWLLSDPTWDAGGNWKYFLSEPSEFIQNHIPFDPMWQLLKDPVSHDKFSHGFGSDKLNRVFNYDDSISAYLQMDSLAQLKSTAYRIEKAGIKNPLVRDNLNYNKMQIEMINQELDVDLYNSAVEDLNDATKFLNEFIQYRNQQFLPEKTDVEMKGLLSAIDPLLVAANVKLDKIDKSSATFAISSEPVRNKLKSLEARLNDQKEFLKNYLGLPKTSRLSAFYK